MLCVDGQMDRQAVSLCVCLMSNTDRIVFPISYLVCVCVLFYSILVRICLRILN
jgi:hypothetical protein